MRSTCIAAVFVVLGAHAAWAEPAPTAQRLPGCDLSAVDPRVDPCGDFYQYACGNWLASNPLPADRARWGRFDAVGEYSREIVRQLVVAAAEPATHASNRWRVNGVVSSFPELAAAFECPASSAMVRASRWRIW